MSEQDWKPVYEQMLNSHNPEFVFKSAFDAQAAEIERLTAELAKAKADERWQPVADEVGRKLLAAEAEAARLREAGARFLAVISHHFPSGVTANEVEAREDFRAALGGKP